MSNRYRAVDTKIRGDARFRALSAPPPSARELWMHLLICGHDRSIPGLLVVGLGALADELEWTTEDVRRCFAEIEGQGMAVADWGARVVWLPKAIAPGRNEPRSHDNVTGFGGAAWAEVPECELKWRAFDGLIGYLATRGSEFVRAAVASMPTPDDVRERAERVAESLNKVPHPKGGAKGGAKGGPKPHPKGGAKGGSMVHPTNPDHDHDPNHDHDHDPPPTPSPVEPAQPTPSPTPPSRGAVGEVVAAWNAGVGSSGIPRLRAPSIATEKRDAQLRAALTRHPDPAAWAWCARALAASAHHRGENERKWRASAEWLLERGNGAKLDEWMQRGAQLRDGEVQPIATTASHRLTPAERMIAETRAMADEIEARGRDAHAPASQGALVLRPHRSSRVARAPPSSAFGDLFADATEDPC